MFPCTMFRLSSIHVPITMYYVQAFKYPCLHALCLDCQVSMSHVLCSGFQVSMFPCTMFRLSSIHVSMSSIHVTCTMFRLSSIHVSMYYVQTVKYPCIRNHVLCSGFQVSMFPCTMFRLSSIHEEGTPEWSISTKASHAK
jgi:hypothetical protein